MSGEILWRDFYKVKSMIKELELGDDLANRFDELGNPFREKKKVEDEN